MKCTWFFHCPSMTTCRMGPSSVYWPFLGPIDQYDNIENNPIYSTTHWPHQPKPPSVISKVRTH